MTIITSKLNMANEAVLKYLQATNRPYSVNDIVLNMHKEFGKTAIQRALDVLVQKGLVLEKVYGKQKVYVVKQIDCEAAPEEEIKDMDRSITEMQLLLKAKDFEMKAIESELKKYQNVLSKEQIQSQIDVLKPEVEKMEEKLRSISSNAVPVSPGKVEAVTKKKDNAFKEYRTNKRLFSDIIEAILSGYPKTKKELFEEIGLETEEEANIKLPSR